MCEIVYCLIDLGLDVSVIVGRKEMAFTLYFIVCCVMIPVQYCIMLLITGRQRLAFLNHHIIPLSIKFFSLWELEAYKPGRWEDILIQQEFPLDNQIH